MGLSKPLTLKTWV